jgi:pantothenate kinase type III
MKNKKHKGGYIFPGFNAYKKIYPQISKKLSFQFKNDVNLDKIPLETNNAINSAIMDSIVQPIIKQYNSFKLPIYITGGDGEFLLKYLENLPIKYKNNLIFNSMKKIIKENGC